MPLADTVESRGHASWISNVHSDGFSLTAGLANPGANRRKTVLIQIGAKGQGAGPRQTDSGRAPNSGRRPSDQSHAPIQAEQCIRIVHVEYKCSG